MKEREAARHGQRFDALDGIRTIAVALVILFHVSAPRMAAGFLGVDIFFVLSGFLITAGLVRQIEEKGKISLVDFWSRRIKRLLPASLLLISLILVWSHLWVPTYRRDGHLLDAWHTILYFAN